MNLAVPVLPRLNANLEWLVAHRLRVRFNTGYLWIGLDWMNIQIGLDWIWSAKLDPCPTLS